MTDIARFVYTIRRNLGESFRLDSRAIANIGCGYCDECEALLELFPGATLTLIDQEFACIDAVERRLLSGIEGRFRTVRGDACCLAETAPGPYDFAIIRHPDISARLRMWAQVFDATVSQVRTGGKILIATYSIGEAEMARGIIQQLPAEAMIADWLGSPPVALAGSDRYILLYTKC